MYDSRGRAGAALDQKIDIDRRRALTTSVNGTSISGLNLNAATPAAPSGMAIVQFQADASKPSNVSAYADTRPSLARSFLLMGA